MNQFLARSKHLTCIVLIPSILCLGGFFPAQAQTTSDQRIRVQNADWNVVGNEIVITYDLIGLQDGKYDVEIAFLNERAREFRLIPNSVSGDVGSVLGAGKGKTIKWDYTKDVSSGLSGSGYYFGFEVTEGGTSFLTVLLLLGGVVGVFLLIFSATPAESE
ncbi:MAG TPA: hypothetical protein VGA55_08800 [Bacteroidota bacterium]